MAPWVVILLFSVGALLLFVLGLSLTLIFKGHHIDSEIGSNKNMRALGITCAAQDARNVRYAERSSKGCKGSENGSSAAYSRNAFRAAAGLSDDDSNAFLGGGGRNVSNALLGGGVSDCAGLCTEHNCGSCSN